MCVNVQTLSFKLAPVALKAPLIDLDTQIRLVIESSLFNRLLGILKLDPTYLV